MVSYEGSYTHGQLLCYVCLQITQNFKCENREQLEKQTIQIGKVIAIQQVLSVSVSKPWLSGFFVITTMFKNKCLFRLK